MVGIVQYSPVGKGRVRVVFDNEISCILYRGECRRLHIEEGGSLQDEDYQYMMEEILGKRAKKRALHLLETMDRSERRLKELLRRSGYPASCIEDALDYVKRFHYLDDERYASNYVRFKQDRISPGQMKQKLMLKGIGRDMAGQVVDREYQGDEDALIIRLLEKRHFDPEHADQKEFNRIYGFLMRRGFDRGRVLRLMK